MNRRANRAHAGPLPITPSRCSSTDAHTLTRMGAPAARSQGVDQVSSADAGCQPAAYQEPQGTRDTELDRLSNWQGVSFQEGGCCLPIRCPRPISGDLLLHGWLVLVPQHPALVSNVLSPLGSSPLERQSLLRSSPPRSRKGWQSLRPGLSAPPLPSVLPLSEVILFLKKFPLQLRIPRNLAFQALIPGAFLATPTRPRVPSHRTPYLPPSSPRLAFWNGPSGLGYLHKL